MKSVPDIFSCPTVLAPERWILMILNLPISVLLASIVCSQANAGTAPKSRNIFGIVQLNNSVRNINGDRHILIALSIDPVVLSKTSADRLAVLMIDGRCDPGALVDSDDGDMPIGRVPRDMTVMIGWARAPAEGKVEVILGVLARSEFRREHLVRSTLLLRNEPCVIEVTNIPNINVTTYEELRAAFKRLEIPHKGFVQ